MIAGVDFPSLFQKDNFTLRRTTGHNMYDPESLISGAEIDAGMTYMNSARDWKNLEDYIAAVSGQWTTDEILARAPRKILSPKLHVIANFFVEEFQHERS